MTSGIVRWRVVGVAEQAIIGDRMDESLVIWMMLLQVGPEQCFRVTGYLQRRTEQEAEGGWV